MNFQFFKQPDAIDCGTACLRMLAKHYGRDVSFQQLRTLSETTREGSSLLGLSEASEKMGFRSLGVKVTFEKLVEEAPLPCIAHWKNNHFIVIYKIKKGKVFISDPAHDILTYTKDEFIKSWIGGNSCCKKGDRSA